MSSMFPHTGFPPSGGYQLMVAPTAAAVPMHNRK